MFPSISNAILSSVVTSSFTATESCQVGVPTGGSYTVKKNNVSTLDTVINLSIGDTLSIARLSSSVEKSTILVSYTYNSVPCKYAIVTGAADPRPRLYSQYQNLVWSDFTPTKHEASVLNMFSGEENTFDMTTIMGGSTSQRLAAMLDPLTNSVYFVDYTGVTRASKTFPNKPIYSTSFFNGAANEYEFYVLTDAGKIYRITRSFVMTESTAVFPYAKTIFTDGENLCLSYLDPSNNQTMLVRFSDLNTYSSVGISGATTFPVLHGIAFNNNNKWLISREFNLYELEPGQTASTANNSNGKSGPMCWHRGKVVVPFSDLHLIRVYQNINGANTGLVNTLDTGDYLPYQCMSDGNHIFITCHDSKDVLRWNGVDSSYDVYSFSKKVTQVSVIDDWLVASHYLQDFKLTYLPNPTITGIGLPAPIGSSGALIGSGYQDYETDGDVATIQLQSNMFAWVNGQKSSTIATGQNLVVGMRAPLGKTSQPVIIGSNVFDYVVEGKEVTTKSMDINLPFEPVIGSEGGNEESTFTFTLPVQLEPSYLSVSQGDVKVNGVSYYGQFLVETDDEVEVTIRIPGSLTNNFTVLNVADSDFTLVASNDTVNDIDIQQGRALRDAVTESEFEIELTGLYYFPELRNATLHVEGQGLVDSFPVLINGGTTVTIQHTFTSGYINDTRSTYLIGPTIYRVQSGTLADGIPAFLDFGTVIGAVPGYEIESDLVTVTEMTPNYPVIVYTRHGLLMSVNGGEYVESASIELGDTIQVKWFVTNLWTPILAIYTILNVVQQVDIGAWLINPPSGAYEEPSPSTQTINIPWLEYDNQSVIKKVAYSGTTPVTTASATSNIVLTQFVHREHPENSPAPQGMALPDSHNEKTAAPYGGYNPQIHEEFAIAATPIFINWSVEEQPLASTGIMEAQHGLVELLSLPPIFVRNTDPHLYDPKQRNDMVDYSRFAEPPVSAVDAVRSELHLVAMYDPQPEFEHVDAIVKYNPKPLYDYWMALTNYDSKPNYDYDHQQIKYDPHMERGNPAIHRLVTPVWDRSIGLYITTDAYPVFGEPENKHNVALIPDRLTSTVLYRYNPGYIKTNKIGFVRLPLTGLFDTSKKTHTLPMVFDTYNEPVTISDNFTKLGGNTSSITAAATGAYYANGLPVTTYQQPEGTWSYIINRTTDLVCEVHETGLFVKAWLLGGG